MPKRYRKKPVVIEAAQVKHGNLATVATWCGGKIAYSPHGETDAVLIETLEGVMRADVGDYVICGVKGEFYPCKPDIFDATYEPA